jgi:hypothetical protein
MITKRLDPEQPKRHHEIWRKVYCLNSMRKVNWMWGYTDEQVKDTGYCLDRYLTLEPKLEG